MPLDALLVRVGSAAARYRRRAAAARGMTSTAFGVLGVLGERDRLSHRELAGRLGVTPATLTPVVDALESTGDVQRMRDHDDRRIVRLTITATGRERWTSASTAVRRDAERRLPRPAPAAEAAIRHYLIAVLAAVADD